MIDIDTFITTLYVIVDDYCKKFLAPAAKRPGPENKLSCSEVITLSIFGQWSRWRSESDFYRFAKQRLIDAFPSLPDRTNYNRLTRQHRDAITHFGLRPIE